MIKINKSVLSIPPYISTQWNQISAISFDDAKKVLVITLTNGGSVNIPNLDKNTIDKVFSMHASHMQVAEQKTTNNASANIQIPFDFSNLQLPGLNSFSSIMQHDEAGAKSPDLPQEVLEKVKAMREALNIDDSALDMPAPVDHCNCIHCQVNRALQGVTDKEPVAEEPVKASDLTFKEWNIEPAGPDLFNVSNPLDEKEQYQVYLGDDNMGCTCGQKNCPHLIAVLKSDA